MPECGELVECIILYTSRLARIRECKPDLIYDTVLLLLKIIALSKSVKLELEPASIERFITYSFEPALKRQIRLLYDKAQTLYVYRDELDKQTIIERCSEVEQVLKELAI